ncbi:hypothetical protein OE09_1502 [Flavobacteriaceae bacterium MAR_2010_72]|nr:hypothetical protein OE09_1502 [Flavobacteriaceae bacterium MAR_2010_72]TVZ59774.1 hypothetical protein NA63_2311 [Flavobacteriaceae bacterium MAR_2010_105]
MLLTGLLTYVLLNLLLLLFYKKMNDTLNTELTIPKMAKGSIIF